MATTDKQAVATPQGITYKWSKDQIEFQLFPEPYFSGADVKIYFGDVWVDDILGISFLLQEQVRPIYSYASRTYKEVSRGNRLVTGKFYIPFREAGYISAIFDHLGQMQIQGMTNTMVSYMENDKREKYHGQIQQTWESLVSEYNQKDPNSDYRPTDASRGEVLRRIDYYEREIWGRVESKDMNHEQQTYFYTSRRNQDWQDDNFRKTGFDIYITYGPVEQAVKVDSTAKFVSFDTTVKAIRQVQLTGSSQDIMGDGTVVEVYDFIAKDLD